MQTGGTGVTTRRVAVIESQQLQLDTLSAAIRATPGLDCVIGVLAGPRPDPLADQVVDTFLVGIHHPGVDLVGHVSALCAAHPRSTIVVLAGYVDLELEAAVTAAGAHAVLPTSASLERVIEAIGGVHGPAAHSTEQDALAQERAARVGMTARQHEVLRHLARGHSPTQVAANLTITLDTCRDHIRALHRVLGCSSTTEVLVVAARTGLLPELGRPLR